MSEAVSGFLWVTVLVLIALIAVGGLAFSVNDERQKTVACMSRGGMYLDQVCVRGEVIDLTKP